MTFYYFVLSVDFPPAWFSILLFFYFKRRTWHINTCNFHFRTGSKEIVSFDLCHDRSKKLSEGLILHNYSYVYTKNQTEVCLIFFLLITKMDFRG